MFVRIGLIEVVGVKEGRVDANGAHPRSTCHAHVIERVTKVGGLVGCRRMAKGRETLDGKALKAEHPAIHAQFTKIGAPSRRFLLKGDK